MLTIFFGSDLKLVENEINKSLEHLNPNEIYSVKNLINFEDAYLLSTQTSLFDEPKAYIFYNDEVFNNFETFNKNYNVLKHLKDSSKNIVILTTKKPNNTSIQITKFLNEVKFIEVKDLNDKIKYNYVKDLLTSEQIYLGSDELDLLVNKLPNNANVISHEINKLLNYGDASLETIKYLISDYKQNSIFDLVQFCFKKDLSNVLYVYENFFKQDPDLNYIIHMISLQLNQLLLAYFLKSKGYDYKQIIDSLGISYYQYKSIDNILRTQSLVNILSIINSLYELDIKVKKNLIDKHHSFKDFLLKLFKGV